MAGLGLGLTTRVETWRCCFGLFGTIYGYYCTAAEQGIFLDGWKNTLRRMDDSYICTPNHTHIIVKKKTIVNT